MKLTWRTVIPAAIMSAAVAAGFAAYERPIDELQTPFVHKGWTERKLVALTFDDGPHPITTALLLDALKHAQVKATFCVVGEKAAEYPALLRRIAKAGHQIACHTYSHHDLTAMSHHEAENELTYWESNIDHIIGKQPAYLRPPGGDYSRDTIRMLHRRGYTLALWSVNPGDWRMPPPKAIVNYVNKKVEPGSVVLMHDDGLNTVRALPEVIRTLREHGYIFVTVAQMAKLQPGSR